MHSAALARLVDDISVDADRIWNLDENGTMPGKDAAGASKYRQYMIRSQSEDMRFPDFASTHHMTMIHVLCAYGETGPVLFVLMGSILPYREVLRESTVMTKTYADHLSWEQSSLRAPTVVLLVYNAYRADMTLRVLEFFKKINVVAYAFPAHMTGKTQPCDTVLFGIFKKKLKDFLLCINKEENMDKIRAFEFCALMRAAYDEAFTTKNTNASFARASIWPLDPYRLLSISRPRSTVDVAEIVGVSDIKIEETSGTVSFAWFRCQGLCLQLSGHQQ
eukprot:IDg17875t1